MTRPVACVVGWPARHSRSPVIHKFWLNQLGIDGDYVIKPVPPDEAEAFFASFATSGFVGCNVTVPHKEIAFAAATRRDKAAAATGALNTLWLEGGKLVGSNTDPIGFLANLDAETPGWDKEPGPAVVLGAGGAARAIVWALITRGFAPIRLVNRSPERPRAIAAHFGQRVEPAAWADAPRMLAGARFVVNTTTLGMAGQPELRLDISRLPDDAVVNDIVYVPADTWLLKAARARGLATAGGLGMLLHQAVPGFQRWFGTRPEVTPALRAAVEASIAAG